MNHIIKIYDKIPDSSVFKLAPFDNKKKHTQPHRHNNYFEIIYLIHGSGHHWIDAHKHDVFPPVVFFLKKNVVHHWKFDGNPEGYVLIVKEGFIEELKDGALWSLISKLHSFNCLYLPNDSGIFNLFTQLEDTTRLTSGGINKRHMIEGLLKTILAKFLVFSDYSKFSDPQQNLYLHFLETITSPGGLGHRTIQQYAESLNTTMRYLNSTCYQITGKSAGQILSEYLVLEAKRWLDYSDLHISEICFKLEFKDPSYFVKYFKRKTGFTPEEYRTINRQISDI